MSSPTYRVFLFRVTFPGKPPHTIDEIEYGAFASSDADAVEEIEAQLVEQGVPIGTRFECLRKIWECDERTSELARLFKPLPGCAPNWSRALDPALNSLASNPSW